MDTKYIDDVVTLKLDVASCIGCGLCEIVCPHAVFVVSDGKAAIVSRDNCMECGACALNCPTEAITVESGVGCASAFIVGALTGTEPSCDCAKGSSCC